MALDMEGDLIIEVMVTEVAEASGRSAAFAVFFAVETRRRSVAHHRWLLYRQMDPLTGSRAIGGL